METKQLIIVATPEGMNNMLNGLSEMLFMAARTVRTIREDITESVHGLKNDDPESSKKLAETLAETVAICEMVEEGIISGMASVMADNSEPLPDEQVEQIKADQAAGKTRHKGGAFQVNVTGNC